MDDETIRVIAVIAAITSRGDDEFFDFATKVEYFIANIEDDDGGGSRITLVKGGKG